MRIKLLSDALGPRGNCGVGCVVDFPDDVARDLIGAGKAEAEAEAEAENVPFHEVVQPAAENSIKKSNHAFYAKRGDNG